MQKRLLFLITLLLAMTTTVMAQVTTSGISGKVVSQGEDVIGATITATHQPSGTVYRAVTNIDGRYTIQGMRVGGPYKVTIAYIGQKTKTFDNVTLRLGETEDLSCSLQDDTKELQEVVVRVVQVSTQPRQVLHRVSTLSRLLICQVSRTVLPMLLDLIHS